MKAGEASFAFLQNEGVVEVPFFQRPYVWDKDNWEDLLEDLLNAAKSHFLGSLILKQYDPISGSPKRVSVIDGQQRLTTLSVLVKVLYDSFSAEVQKRCEHHIKHTLFYQLTPTSKDFYVKINHSHVDARYYEMVICAGVDGKELFMPAEDAPNKILRCYAYFSNKLREAAEHNRLSLFDRILDHQNKMIVVIDLDKNDNEQAIFDTINSAGVRLSCADTIKNALFQRVIEIMGKERALELYKSTWEKTFLADDTAVGYWESLKVTGRLKRDNIEILLHSIAVIEGFYDPETDVLSDLADKYKHRITDITGEKDLEGFINDIVEYAGIYRTKMPTVDRCELFDFADGTRRLLYILDLLEISTFHPFILFAFKEYKDDDARLSQLLLSLEKLVVRRMVGKAETKSYNKLCKSFILSPNDIGQKAAEISDATFAQGLRAIANKHAALLLFWVELKRRSVDHKQGVKELKYTYSLEHIMPQKWTEHWGNIPEKRNADGGSMGSEEAAKDRAEKIYWIGNMTLLTAALNTALRNYDFATKIVGQGRKRGMNSYADLSITRDDIIRPFENGDPIWDENKILKRTAKLEKEIDEIWGVRSESTAGGCLAGPVGPGIA